VDTCSNGKPRVRRGDVPLLPSPHALRLAGVAKALSDPIRLQMLHLLDQRPNLCTCEFEELLELGQSKVSYHLKVLLDARLVTRETYGTWSHYRLAHPSPLAHLETLAGAPEEQLAVAD
jgi:ArsR family transcriptional regulator, arsenate/arsenite/antimonite-responsive transcriptional repressor